MLSCKTEDCIFLFEKNIDTKKNFFSDTKCLPRSITFCSLKFIQQMKLNKEVFLEENLAVQFICPCTLIQKKVSRFTVQLNRR